MTRRAKVKPPSKPGYFRICSPCHTGDHGECSENGYDECECGCEPKEGNRT